MPNLSGLSNATMSATALSNLILVTPKETGYQPQSLNGAQQPPSILFNYEGEQTVSLESDITDHFIEDNTAIQDQWSLKPEVVTTHGFIGELNDVPPFGLSALKFIADKLTAVSAYEPALSISAQIAYANAFQLYQASKNVLNSAVSAWSSLTGSGNQNKQQIAFQQFYGYWKSRTLFTVQTPWAIFDNMAIKSLRAIQDAETRMITDFEVSFKMIRVASTSSTLLQASAQGRLDAQSSTLTDLGTQTPKPSVGLGTGLTQMGVA